MKKNSKASKLTVGRVFFVPFQKKIDGYGVFGYVKYDASIRTNPRSLVMSLGDIYGRVCRLNEWSDDIKNGEIKIHDMIVNESYFQKTKHNKVPMILTDYYTDIIHPVKHGFFMNDYEKYWYDADATYVNLPKNESRYRRIEISFPPYDQNYIEKIFDGKNIKYGDFIPDFCE